MILEHNQKLSLEEVSELTTDILEKLGSFCASEDLIFGIKLSLEEALINAIKHGNKMDSSKSVHLKVEADAERIEIEIKDEGQGFDQHRLDDEKLTTYSSREKPAIDAVMSGDCDITFLLNPTKIEQVRRIAEEGLIMPRKATYFYPKVITGLVLNRLA